jgi:DNA repair exonuclease SbcCD ATPase subunit
MQNLVAKPTPHNLQKLIVLGAGDLTLKSLQAWSAKQVILVDASSDVCDQLNALVQGLEEETVFSVQNIAIADKQETRTFQHLNLPELSGFNLPAGLKKLYPGLKTVESQSMQTHSLQDFLANQDLECDANSKNGLIIDIPTQLDELLKALLESEFLSCFKEIQFSASSMPLDKDVQSNEYWLNQFQAKGFELQNRSNLNDDFINYTMVKNPLFNQLQMLKQQLQQQQAQNKKLETQANEMAEMLEKQNQLISTKDKEVKDCQAWLNEAKQALATESDALNTQLAAVRKQADGLTQERNHEQKRKDDEKVKNENLTQENNALCSENTAIKEQLVKLKQEHDALKEQNAKQIETLKSEREHIRAERDSARKERDDLKGKIDQKDKKVITLTKQLNDTQVQLNNGINNIIISL